MRIESSTRSSPLGRSAGVGRAAPGTGFAVPDEAAAPRLAPAPPAAPATGLAALLALQAVEDPLFAKKKALRRGNGLLDALEAIKADLLVGRVSEGRLNQVMALIGQARERQQPELDAVLDDIELRARVELAKFGRFPA